MMSHSRSLGDLPPASCRWGPSPSRLMWHWNLTTSAPAATAASTIRIALSTSPLVVDPDLRDHQRGMVGADRTAVDPSEVRHGHPPSIARECRKSESRGKLVPWNVAQARQPGVLGRQHGRRRPANPMPIVLIVPGDAPISGTIARVVVGALVGETAPFSARRHRNPCRETRRDPHLASIVGGEDRLRLQRPEMLGTDPHVRPPRRTLSPSRTWTSLPLSVAGAACAGRAARRASTERRCPGRSASGIPASRNRRRAFHTSIKAPRASPKGAPARRSATPGRERSRSPSRTRLLAGVQEG